MRGANGDGLFHAGACAVGGAYRFLADSNRLVWLAVMMLRKH